MRSELRSFVLGKARGPVEPAALTDQTPLLADGWLRSVHLPELLLLLERLRGTPIEVEDLRPGDFRDIETLVSRFGVAGIADSGAAGPAGNDRQPGAGEHRA